MTQHPDTPTTPPIAEPPGPDREALTHAVMMVLASHPTSRALAACHDVLASVIGLMARDIGTADAICDTIPADLKSTIRDNWGECRRLAAQARQTGRA